MKILIAIATVTLLAIPAFAETAKIDPMKMTCAELMAMDAKGMMSAGTELKTAMKADAKVAAMKDEDVTKAAEVACKAHPDAGVVDAMHM